MRKAVLLGVCVVLSAAPAAPAGPTGAEILKASGVRGGLVVHLGCGSGEVTASLRGGGRYVVHGLGLSAADVARARTRLHKAGLYGPVSVALLDGNRLPYVDNLVNLLVADGLGGVPPAEVMRVLAPDGVAMIGGERTVKPRPAGIDEWTHFLHGPTNNAMALDTVVGPPRHMQWLAGPRWTRHHHADKGTYPAIRAVVSAAGRLYYLADETPSSNRLVASTWFLAARDGFSGVLLWKKRLAAETFERRLEQLWRGIVADGGRVYVSLGADAPLSALDGATGEVIRSYPGTEGFREVIKDGRTLLTVSADGAVLAVAADTGKRLWRWEPGADGQVVPLTLAASGGKVFVRTDQSACGLSAETGKRLWRTALPGPRKKVKLRWPRERLLVADGVVLCSYGGEDPKDLDRDKFEFLGSHPRVRAYDGKLAALSAHDGRVLWRSPYMPGLESMPGEMYVADGTVWLGPAFDRPRDLRTGAVRATRPVIERLWTTGHHYRCYPGKATCRYIITAKRGVEMIDLHGEGHSRNNWVRATCRVGVTPCNGLLYAPPHSCGCYMEARLYGFWALAAGRARPIAPDVADGERLEKGPAYGRIADSTSRIADAPSQKATRAAWRTYRGDAARSGSTGYHVPRGLRRLWKADVGGKLTGVTAAGGKAYVAQVDGHTLHALDAGSGKGTWQFTAGGRIDSPPTLHRGRVLFGARDGCVYCLRAADGRLAWRFLAAPGRCHAVAWEQVESLWPVHGSVLVHEGIAYAAAGRSSHLDGGIALWGLDPQTGAVRCRRRIVSEHAGASAPPPQAEQARMSEKISQNYTDYKTFLAPDRSDAFSMRGAITDVLTADGGSIFMRQARFDGSLEPKQGGRPHLFSTSSFLDGSEHHRLYWLLGTGDFSRLPVAYPWLAMRRQPLAVPFGLMLAFDARTVWGVRRIAKRGHYSAYAAFATPRPDPDDPESSLGDFARRSARTKPTGTAWTVDLDFRPRAVIRAGAMLLIGGKPAGPSATGGLLRVLSCEDGRTVEEITLSAAPVWDGLATAGGRLFAALEDGGVVCLGK